MSTPVLAKAIQQESRRRGIGKFREGTERERAWPGCLFVRASQNEAPQPVGLARLGVAQQCLRTLVDGFEGLPGQAAERLLYLSFSDQAIEAGLAVRKVKVSDGSRQREHRCRNQFTASLMPVLKRSHRLGKRYPWLSLTLQGIGQVSLHGGLVVLHVDPLQRVRGAGYGVSESPRKRGNDSEASSVLALGIRMPS